MRKDAPIAPEKLIEMTRKYAGTQSLEEQSKVLADEYVFRGPGAHYSLLGCFRECTLYLNLDVVFSTARVMLQRPW